jgi:hypothetical protein
MQVSATSRTQLAINLLATTADLSSILSSTSVLETASVTSAMHTPQNCGLHKQKGATPFFIFDELQ